MSRSSKLVEIMNFLVKCKIEKENIIINDDFTVDILNDEHVEIYDKELKEIPIQFGRVTGNFDCAECKLTTLKGSPKYVGGDFNCSSCRLLASLEGGPEYVSNNFYCSGCDSLTTLNGAPKYIGGSLWCQFNENLISIDDLKSTKIRGNKYFQGSNKIPHDENNPFWYFER